MIYYILSAIGFLIVLICCFLGVLYLKHKKKKKGNSERDTLPEDIPLTQRVTSFSSDHSDNYFPSQSTKVLLILREPVRLSWSTYFHLQFHSISISSNRSSHPSSFQLKLSRKTVETDIFQYFDIIQPNTWCKPANLGILFANITSFNLQRN